VLVKKISEEAKAWWSKIEKEVVDDARIQTLDRAGVIDTRWVQIYEHERFGYQCPCGKPWVKVEFTNELGSVSYYKPQCSCLPVCVYCGRVLVQELSEQLPDCIHCFHTKETGHWNLQPCGKRVQKKTTSRYGQGGGDTGKYETCDGWMKLANAKGDFVCDKCGRRTRRTRDDDNGN
jgi:ribosomal protein L37AE/L43A